MKSNQSNTLNFSQLSKWSFTLFFFLILIFATFTRFYKLAEVPHGMTWDEAAIGYNGYAVLTTRRDEWLKRFPISFRSFGDYKAPLAIYINGLFTYLFGMNLWAVRLPFALAGVAGIAGWMIFVRLFWRNVLHSKDADRWSLIAGALMTFSPWHFHFSRVGFESGMALTFMIWGMIGLFHLLFKEGENTFQSFNQSLIKNAALVSFISIMFVSSIYTYHSAKIFIPLIVLSILIIFSKQIFQKKMLIGCIGFMSGVLLLPFLYDSLKANGSERLTQASIFGLQLSPAELITQFFKNFLVHLSPQFLILGATTTLRHGDGHWGVLFVTTFLLLLCGLAFGLREIYFSKKGGKSLILSSHTQLFLFSISWIVIGIIPAAIGRDVPHSNRALLALPGFLLLALYGAEKLMYFLTATRLNKQVSGSKGESNLLVKSAIGCLILSHCLLSASFLHEYFTQFNKISSDDFKDGYLEAMEYAKENEESVDKILFTDAYGQPYIYALFARQTNPIWYQGGSLIKYEFSSHVNPGDMSRKNTLIIATPKEIEADRGQRVIRDEAGNVRFVLMKTP